MINEVSQGTGTSEYVEFVVIGSPICEGDPIPCIDLRRVVFDDNNGFFQQDSTNGTGIASGALRFSRDAFWSCIPQGTFIIVYNEASRNSSLPIDDLSLTDGNCTLIIPGNSSLIESPNTVPLTPNTNTSLYPTLDSEWGSSTGWAGTSSQGVSMSNSNDSFQIPNLGVNGTPLHSVSWGNNVDGAIIYFPGPVGSQVISFKNIVSNDFNDQQNWVIEPIASGQSPGIANSPENDAWIGTMNPTCRINPTLSFSITDATCQGNDGSITVIVNGNSTYSYLWDNGSQSATISNLIPGNYSVTVTDNVSGCVYAGSTDVIQGNGNLSLTVTKNDVSCTGLCDGTAQIQINGGQAPFVEIWQFNGQASSAPTNACEGTYFVEVTDDNGCIVNETISLGATTILSYQISPDTTICRNDSITLSVTGANAVLWSTGASTNSINIQANESSNYTVVITENSCTVTETISISTKQCEFNILFPNVFTPDGDLINDNYVPIAFTGVTNKSFIIVNRWGNVVYETLDQQINWDGKINGKDASEAVYFYKCIYENFSKEEFTAHGFLQLLRK